MISFVAALVVSPRIGLSIVSAARSQIRVTVRYDPTYRKLAYPSGDVNPSSGVCTDVIVRALRKIKHLDLQKAIHEDMLNNWSTYPHKWGLKKPDSNIDHRRVPNLQVFFRHQGWQVRGDYLPGDLVTCLLPKNLPHIMVVSDKLAEPGRYLVIHNIGAGTKEEDSLIRFRITGHFRVRG